MFNDPEKRAFYEQLHKLTGSLAAIEARLAERQQSQMPQVLADGVAQRVERAIDRAATTVAEAVLTAAHRYARPGGHPPHGGDLLAEEPAAPEEGDPDWLRMVSGDAFAWCDVCQCAHVADYPNCPHERARRVGLLLVDRATLASLATALASFTWGDVTLPDGTLEDRAISGADLIDAIGDAVIPFLAAVAAAGVVLPEDWQVMA